MFGPLFYVLCIYMHACTKEKKKYNSVQFSSVQDCRYALEKAHMRATPSLRRFPNIAFETVPMFV